MGCDIHGALQIRYSANSSYRSVQAIPRNRNYTLFAALADVRNYDSIKPLAPDRGVPADITYDSDDAFDEEGNRKPGRLDLGDHSMTWMTLTEVLEWPGWDQTVARTRLVDRVEYDRMLAAGETQPHSYCGDAWGPGILKVQHSEVLDGTADPKWTHVWYPWTFTLREECETFHAWLKWISLEYGWLLAADRREPDPAALRIVIGFDS